MLMKPARGAENVGEHGPIIVIHHLAGGDREIEAAIRPDTLKRETILVGAHGNRAGLAVLVVLVEQRDQPRSRQAARLGREVLRDRLEGQDNPVTITTASGKAQTSVVQRCRRSRSGFKERSVIAIPHKLTRPGCSHGAPGSNDDFAMFCPGFAQPG